MFVIAILGIRERKNGRELSVERGSNGVNHGVKNTLRAVSKCQLLVNQNERQQLSCLEKYIGK